MLVTVRFEGDPETQTFLLGAREMDDEGVEVFSPQSPLGAAINGASRGEKVSYAAPNGKELSVEIVDATPYQG